MRIQATVGLFLLFSASPLAGAVHVWSGASSGSWALPANWASGGVPGAGEPNVVLQFPPGAATKTMTNDLPGLTISSIDFTDHGYDLSGLPLTMAGSIAVTGGNGIVTVATGLVLTQDLAVSCDQPRVLLLLGAISGGFGIQKAGTGNVTLGSPNTYAGQTVVNAGGIRVGAAGALGAADGTAATGTVLASSQSKLFLGSPAPNTVAGEMLTMADGSLMVPALPEGTWAGPVVVSGRPKLPVNAIPLTISGVISGSGGIDCTSFGAGRVTFSGNNTYSSFGQVNGGTTFVNGAQPGSPWTIGFGSLGGNGVVGPVQHGGVGLTEGLRPGSGPSLPGILTIQGNLTMNLGGTIEIDVAGPAPGTQYDRVTVNGTVAINGVTLNLVPTVAVPVGTQLLLVDNDGADPISGTFGGIAEGASVVLGGQAFQATYLGGTGNDFVLTRVAGVPVELQFFDAD